MGEGKLPLPPELKWEKHGENSWQIYFWKWKCGRFGLFVLFWHSEPSAWIHASGRAILAVKNCEVDHIYINNLALSFRQAKFMFFTEEQARTFPAVQTAQQHSP